MRRNVSVIATIALVAAVVAAIVPVVSGDQPSSPVVPQPVLGVGDSDMKLMGSSSPDTGETWAYRELPLSAGDPIAGGQPLQLGPQTDPASRQLAFLRYTASAGWQYVDTPLDAGGHPLRFLQANASSARITAKGGGVLVARDLQRAAGNQVVVLRRDPGTRFQALPDPPPGVLGTGESLAADAGLGRAPVAAFDDGHATHAFLAATGPAAEAAVLRWDGQAWTREPVVVPAGSESDFKILALTATGDSSAWMVASTAEALGRGIALFQRQDSGGGPRWVERSLGASPFAHATSAGIAEVTALGGQAQPLTATPDGVWIDGSIRVDAEGGALETFTLFFQASSGKVTGSWCDVTICDHRLGARLSTQIGYRSFAWSGSGFGTRVITNPLDPGGTADTNRGTYLSLSGTTFERMPGGGGNFHPDGAFSAPDEGWLWGPIHITRQPDPQRLRAADAWPVAARAPLAGVAAAPGAAPGALGSGAVAVGLDGTVLRYQPGAGWQREFLLASNGAVVKSNLRGVAWPEPGRAYAVGDFGSMWLWRADTGLWERDPGAPVGFDGNLMDVAFAPGDPNRGYAVGRSGVLLSYGKSWAQDSLPSGFEGADFTQIAFAGSEAIVAAGSDLLLNDGSGWRVDQGAHDLLHSLGDPQLLAVAGLPDGGAVAAGRDIVIERDGPGSAWRTSDQPLPGSTVVAAAAVRDGAQVRAIVSVVPTLRYPPADDIPAPDPNVPPPILPAFRLPGDGYVLAETDTGWRDEQHTAFAGSGADRPVKSDPILAFMLDSAGRGWAVGGWSGEADAAGRGSSGAGSDGKTARQRVQTAGVYRYGDAAAPPGSGVSGIPLPGGVARFAIAGHAACAVACADLSLQDIRPDRSLTYALSSLATLHAAPGGPRALLYTGGRLAPGVGAADAPREFSRYAELLASGAGLPVYPAASGTDAAAGIASFQAAFRNFYSPFGQGPQPPGVDSSLIPNTPAGDARTYYAFDTAGDGGTTRVIVIDNSAGSLEASAPGQTAWLTAVLNDAKTRGIPSIVVGSRDLNTRFSPRLNTATDGDATANLLVAGGASAYFFERPEENRAYPIPAGGGSRTIPSFGTGTLGYRSAVSDPSNATQPDSTFGESGYLLAEIDVAHRNPATNQAPVRVRMVPLIEDLSLQPVDGTLIRRSRPALFQGLGRRPLAGDRWGKSSGGSGTPNPPGSDPYISFPPPPCLIAGCSTKLSPEYSFYSSDPDIGDFVEQDPQSTNLRKPFLDAHDKTVTDSQSGLFCAFNAGTTTVTVTAGGRAFSQAVQVLPGSVQRPCGTRPLNPSRFRRAPSGSPTAPPPPAPAPNSSPPVSFQPPPPPAPAPPVVHARPSPPFVPSPTPQAASLVFLPPVPLPVPPPAVRPSPPSGGLGRAYQVEEKREEEVAPEESQAFARYHPDGGGLPPAFVVGMLVLAALAGATIRGGPRGMPKGGIRAAPVSANTSVRRSRPR
jgi:hypothetical protein